MRNLTLFPLMLLLFAGSCAAQPEISQPEITQVEVGIDGRYKLGKWTQIRIHMSSDKAVTGRLEIVTTDGEGVQCSYVVDDCAVEQGTSQQSQQIRIGQGKQLKVRFVTSNDEMSEFDVPLASDPVSAWQQWVLAIGSDIDIDESLRQFRRPKGEEVVGSYVSKTELLPREWLSYDGVDLVLLTTGAMRLDEQLSPAQLEALESWVAKGGRIVISAARNAESLMGQGAPLEQLAPGPFQEVMLQRQTTALEEYAETSQRLDTLLQDATGRIEGLPTAIFENRDGIVEVEEGFGRERSAWLIRRSHGFGMVTLLATDLDTSPIADWQPRNRLINRLLDDALPGWYDEVEEIRGGQVTHVGYRDLTGQMRAAMEQFSAVRLVPFSLIAGMAVTYILLIGPFDFLFLRRLQKRMNLTWVTFPLIVLGTCLAAGLLATRWKGAEVRVNEVHVVDIDGGTNEFRSSTWTHVYTPRTQELAVSLLPATKSLLPTANLETTRLAWQGLPGTGFGGMSATSRHGAFLRPYEIFVDEQTASDEPRRVVTGLRNLSMPKWSSRALSGVTWGSIKSPLFAGNVTSNRDGLLEGEITNPFPVPMRDAAICYGRWYYSLGTLAVGQTVPLSAQTPKDLRTHLTKRAFIASESQNSTTSNSKEISTPWDAESLDLGPIVQMIMFHDSAGGRSNYTNLLHRFESTMDMSNLVKTNRAVLFAKVGRSVSDVAIDGAPHTDQKGQRLTYCRFVYPMSGAANSNQTASE